jgi:hypothetical protein
MDPRQKNSNKHAPAVGIPFRLLTRFARRSRQKGIPTSVGLKLFSSEVSPKIPF